MNKYLKTTLMPKIINFHDIYDPQWFRDTIEVILESYEIVPFSTIKDFYNGKKINPKAVHLTIDDGHISTYTIIYPILKELGLTASIFVSPKIIKNQTNFWYAECGDYETEQLKECIAEVLEISKEKLANFYPISVMKTLSLATNWEIIKTYQNKFNIPTKSCQYITVEQLLELEHSGIFTIGAHTMNHPILANESNIISEKEIKDSITELSELLCRNVESFAYPNGSKGLDFGKREIDILKQCNINYAFSFEFKNLNLSDNLLTVPRYGLYHGDKNFIRKKLKFGAIWEPFKKVVFNNEDKHRKLIKKSTSI